MPQLISFSMALEVFPDLWHIGSHAILMLSMIASTIYGPMWLRVICRLFRKLGRAQ